MSEKPKQDDLDQREALLLRIIEDKIGIKLDKLEKNSKGQDSLICEFKTEIEDAISKATKINNELTVKHEAETEIKEEVRNPDVLKPTKVLPAKSIKANAKEDSKKSEPQGAINKPKPSPKNLPEEKKAKSDSDTKKVEVKNKTQEEEEEEERKTGNNEGFLLVRVPKTPEQKAALERCQEIIKELDIYRISIITSFNPPLKSIAKIMEAVCVILDEDPSWDNVQKITQQGDFLSRLSEFKGRLIAQEKYEKVKRILNQKETQLEYLTNISTTAKLLCEWFHSFLKCLESLNSNTIQNNHQEEVETLEEEMNGVDMDYFEQEKILKQIALEEECCDIIKGFDKRNLIEIKAFAKPPLAILRIFEAACILLGEKVNWMGAKIAMADVNGFFRRLLEVKGKSLPYQTYKRAKYILSDQEMAPENIMRFSLGGKLISEWAHNIIKQREVWRGSDGTPEEMEEERRKQIEQEEKEEEKELRDLKKIEDREAEIKAKKEAQEKEAMGMEEKEKSSQLTKGEEEKKQLEDVKKAGKNVVTKGKIVEKSTSKENTNKKVTPKNQGLTKERKNIAKSTEKKK